MMSLTRGSHTSQKGRVYARKYTKLESAKTASLGGACSCPGKHRQSCTNCDRLSKIVLANDNAALPAIGGKCLCAEEEDALRRSTAELASWTCSRRHNGGVVWHRAEIGLLKRPAPTSACCIPL